MGFFSAVRKFFGKPAEKTEGPAEIAAREEAAGESLEARDVSEDMIQPPAYGGKQENAAGAGSGMDAEDTRLLVALRASEPKLSAWLGVALEGVTGPGDLLWHRLSFLLRSLDAPQAEIDAFLADFRSWLEKMEYVRVEEFASELQYRLALALDLEDEEDERNRLFLKFGQGLAKTRDTLGRSLNALFAGSRELDDSFWEQLEELFIMADMGYDASISIVKNLREAAIRERIDSPEGIRPLLVREMENIFRQPKKIGAVNRPEVILMIGVNGVGKTTTIAKLAYRDKLQGKKPLIVGADTFRAAAIEQLQVWADRVGADFFSRENGSDPAAVAWEAMDLALKGGYDTVYIDTAGRLQTKVNLMEELGKIHQVLSRKHEGAPHRTILVLDATTGQNALSQAKLFGRSAAIDELILTKLDGTAKGGVALAVAMQEKLPITYVGLGEKMEDLRPFNGADYARGIFGEKADAA